MNYDEYLSRQAENYYEGEKMMNSFDFEKTKRNLYSAVKKRTGIKLLDNEAEAFTDKLMLEWNGESEKAYFQFMDEEEIGVKVEIIERTRAEFEAERAEAEAEYMTEAERGN